LRAVFATHCGTWRSLTDCLQQALDLGEQLVVYLGLGLQVGEQLPRHLQWVFLYQERLLFSFKTQISSVSMTIIAVKKTFKTIIAVKKTLILCKRFKDISYFSRMRSLVGYAHAPVLHVAFVSALALARGFCPWLLHVLARGFLHVDFCTWLLHVVFCTWLLHVAFARFSTWFFARGFCTWLLHVVFCTWLLHVAFARFSTWFFAHGFCTWLLHVVFCTWLLHVAFL
jgi:hypothetical protein